MGAPPASPPPPACPADVHALVNPQGDCGSPVVAADVLGDVGRDLGDVGVSVEGGYVAM